MGYVVAVKLQEVPVPRSPTVAPIPVVVAECQVVNYEVPLVFI